MSACRVPGLKCTSTQTDRETHTHRHAQTNLVLLSEIAFSLLGLYSISLQLVEPHFQLPQALSLLSLVGPGWKGRRCSVGGGREGQKWTVGCRKGEGEKSKKKIERVKDGGKQEVWMERRRVDREMDGGVWKRGCVPLNMCSPNPLCLPVGQNVKTHSCQKHSA